VRGKKGEREVKKGSERRKRGKKIIKKGGSKNGLFGN